jgi:hypothetical protein
MNLIIHGLIPLLLLVALNVCIYRQLRQHFSHFQKRVKPSTVRQKHGRILFTENEAFAKDPICGFEIAESL